MHRTDKKQLQLQVDTAKLQIYKIKLRFEAKCDPKHAESINLNFEKVMQALKEFESHIYKD